MPNINSVDVDIRRDQELLCGRLIALPSTVTAAQMKSARDVGAKRFISIDFPAMPDTIELARSAEYLVSSSVVTPDGIHQYKSTKPLEIPFSFRLHSFDEPYCKKGALTLLQLAARLHSFILPISTFGTGATLMPALFPKRPATSGKLPDANIQTGAAQTNVVKVVGLKTGAIYSPITCWLHLMWTTLEQPGISCIGYVREVSVKFNGPWLRGPTNSFNLPSSADFSFTFVHRPGQSNTQAFHTSQEQPNTLSSAGAGQWYADNVRERLYNNRDLVHAANYQGFANNATSTTQPPTVPPPPPPATPPPAIVPQPPAWQGPPQPVPRPIT